ncbi:MAG: hypothetical protein V2B15_17505 [Bacteroidota bacterium]
MKYIYRLMAIVGLTMTLVPPILYYAGSMAGERMKLIMFLGTLLWFSGAIPWLGKKKTVS